MLLSFSYSTLRIFIIPNTARSTFFKQSSLLISKSAIDLARRFNEMFVFYATYKTNRHKLPFMNIVSIKNTGYPSVFSFCVADGWITIETSENFTWFLKKLKDVVSDETQ